MTVFICGKDELALRTAILELPMEHISSFLRFLRTNSLMMKVKISLPITPQSYAKENQCIEITAVAVLFVQLPLFDSEAEMTFSPALVALLSAMILVSLEPPSSHFWCNLSVWPSAKKEPL